ncbi:MAG: stalk domain-containing protein [Clostridia bacterium]|nr:stalk domain-containing protein [Clostridia bacterium]
MKRLLLLIAAIIAVFGLTAHAESSIGVTINGEVLQMEQPPVIQNGRTLVPVRSVCEAMNLNVVWDGKYQTVKIFDEDTIVKMSIGYYNIDVNEGFRYLDSPPVIVNGTTCVPIRAVLEAFGATLDWDGETQTVVIFAPHLLEDTERPTVTPKPTDKPSQKPDEKADTQPVDTPNSDEDIEDEDVQYTEEGYPFYAQPDEEWGFEGGGRGYCWVCSYAMLISNITGERVTPTEIAEYNINAGYDNGAYISSHYGIASEYGLKFVKALPEDSIYYDYFDSLKRGATYLKAETEEDVINALIEVLDYNPQGVMVRFEGYPHTLVATGYYGDEIYFNDPASLTMENVTFEDTCLSNGFELTDISFVQALREK